MFTTKKIAKLMDVVALATAAFFSFLYKDYLDLKKYMEEAGMAG